MHGNRTPARPRPQPRPQPRRQPARPPQPATHKRSHLRTGPPSPWLSAQQPVLRRYLFALATSNMPTDTNTSYDERPLNQVGGRKRRLEHHGAVSTPATEPPGAYAELTMAPHADPDTTADGPTPDAPSPDMRRLTTPGQDRLEKIPQSQPNREPHLAPPASGNTGGPVLRGDKSGASVETAMHVHGGNAPEHRDQRKLTQVPRSHASSPEISTLQAATAATATNVAIRARPVAKPPGDHTEPTTATRAHPRATADVRALCARPRPGRHHSPSPRRRYRPWRSGRVPIYGYRPPHTSSRASRRDLRPPEGGRRGSASRRIDPSNGRAAAAGTGAATPRALARPHAHRERR